MNKIEQAIREQFKDNFATDEEFTKWLRDTIFTISFDTEQVLVGNIWDWNFETKDCFVLKTTSKSSGIQNISKLIPPSETKIKKHQKEINKNINKEYNTSQKRTCYVSIDGKELLATFLTWGITYDEFESGPAQYTIGIVEMQDGIIKVVYPDKIKFCKE